LNEANDIKKKYCDHQFSIYRVQIHKIGGNAMRYLPGIALIFVVHSTEQPLISHNVFDLRAIETNDHDDRTYHNFIYAWIF